MLIHQPVHQSFLEAFLSARRCQRNLRSKGRVSWAMAGLLEAALNRRRTLNLNLWFLKQGLL